MDEVQGQGTTESGRMLIVDDDEMVGHTLERMARREGLDVRFTCDPEEFLALAASWHPGIVAIDLVMPGMDGVQVLKELAESGLDPGVIVTSGVGQRVLDAAARSASEHGLHMLGILPKPFSPGDVRRLLATGREKPAANGQAPVRETTGRSTGPEISEEMILDGLERDQFVVQYQPKVACADGRLAGFEALVRWAHPDHGTIPPGDFIALAEHGGLMSMLSARVFDRALEWFGSLRQTGSDRDALTLSLNLSARILEDAELVDRISDCCRLHGVAHQQVILELTETSAMSDPVQSLDLLTRLRVAGYKLSIDDFGTGFSSMVQLVRLPFSEVKIDKSFVISAGSSEESRTVVHSIIELAKALGLQTTAEGVETEWTLDYLRELGCDFAQGFLISRPVDGDELRERWNL